MHLPPAQKPATTATDPSASPAAASTPTGGLVTGGPRLVEVQRALNAQGFACGDPDGIMGSRTRAAVVAFQRARHLDPDGLVGPLTLGAIGVAPGAPATPAPPTPGAPPPATTPPSIGPGPTPAPAPGGVSPTPGPEAPPPAPSGAGDVTTQDGATGDAHDETAGMIKALRVYRTTVKSMGLVAKMRMAQCAPEVVDVVEVLYGAGQAHYDAGTGLLDTATQKNADPAASEDARIAAASAHQALELAHEEWNLVIAKSMTGQPGSATTPEDAAAAAREQNAAAIGAMRTYRQVVRGNGIMAQVRLAGNPSVGLQSRYDQAKTSLDYGSMLLETAESANADPAAEAVVISDPIANVHKNLDYAQEGFMMVIGSVAAASGSGPAPTAATDGEPPDAAVGEAPEAAGAAPTPAPDDEAPATDGAWWL